MDDGRDEQAFLREGVRVGHHRKRIYMQAVVIVEAQGAMLDHARVELESARLQPLQGAQVVAAKNRHIVVDGIEEAQEDLLRVDVLLAVGAQQNVLALLEPEAGMDIAVLNLGEVVIQHLCHRRTRDIRACIGQITACVLGIGHIHIGDDIDNAAVRLLLQTLVFAAVAGFHVEDRRCAGA